VGERGNELCGWNNYYLRAECSDYIINNCYLCGCVCFSLYVFDIESAMCKALRFIPLEKEVFV